MTSDLILIHLSNRSGHLNQRFAAQNRVAAIRIASSWDAAFYRIASQLCMGALKVLPTNVHL